jgi:hypothetical protein
MGFTLLRCGWPASAGFCLSAALVASACGPSLPRVDSLQVERSSWDSLVVVLHFDRDLSRDSGQADFPHRVEVTLFDAAYDTLYAGSDSVIFVPDGTLGSNEPILVEACGVFDSGMVCEQRSIHASPKRIITALELEYPSDAEMARGKYRLSPSVERTRFGTNQWEEIDAEIPGPMVATVRVLNTEDRGIRIPVSPTSGRFDLSRASGYRDYHFFLRSAFRDAGEARVEFNVMAAYANGPLAVGSSVVTVTRKSEEDQVAEVSLLAEQAGRKVLRRLSGLTGAGRAFVFVNDWEYLPETRRYRAEIELHWRTRGGRVWHELVGALEATDQGLGGHLELLRANPAARRRWRSEVRGEVMDLDALNLGDPERGVPAPDGPDVGRRGDRGGPGR